MIRRNLIAIIAATALGGCATHIARDAATTAAPIDVGILAINDFHGNLQPPRISVQARNASGEAVAVPAGGAAYLASTISSLRRGHSQSITVSAGDMTGASPLVSSLFLDEPTIAAMNAIGLDLNAAGNHEFDRGTEELKRLQNGGCEKHAVAAPCQLHRFTGATFHYLAGNAIGPTGESLFPGTAIRSFGEGARKIKIGFIGLTTRSTASLVSPGGIRGITFADEAETANRLVPGLRAAGADTIVLLIHEGGNSEPDTDPNACEGLTGAIRGIVDRLDPAISTVVSGHTHKAYICDYARPGAAPVLLTSAGRYGILVTDLTLRFDPASKRLVGRSARNVIVQSEGFTTSTGVAIAPSDVVPHYTPDPAVAAIVSEYAKAVAPLQKRIVGHLNRAPEPRLVPGKPSYNGEIGNLIADAQLAAARPAAGGGAQVAFMNPTGIRADLKPAPDGSLSFGDIYAVQPFGNTLLVREYSGAQLRAVLEQQFGRPGGMLVLNVSGMTYAFDRSRPAGQRILDAMVGGQPLDDNAAYRVVVSNFLASGGDEFTAFTAGRAIADNGVVDVDAVEAYLAASAVVMVPGDKRIADRTPADWAPPPKP